MALLKIDIVSPNGQIISNRESFSLSIPSTVGELFILPGHIDMICLMDKGPMTIDGVEKYVVYGGTAEVSEGRKVTIIADNIKPVSELDFGKISNELKTVENKLLTEILDNTEYDAVTSRYDDLKAELGSIGDNVTV
ncbi:MAG: hypothetical protein WCQ47_00100 [bacterium]